MTGPPALSVLDLSLAAGFLVLNGAVSLAFRLGLGRAVAIAAVRMVAQLLAAGFVLRLVFAEDSPAWTLAVAALMIAVAGWEILARQERRLPAVAVYAVSTGTMLFAGTLVTLVTVGGLVGTGPWTEARTLLPILGMVLGNAMTAASLVLDTLTRSAVRERTAIEARLALGASRFEAFQPALAAGLRTGLIPIVNAMAAAGVVSLPGMMTGQILAGVDPLEAAKYQILIMLVLAGATALAGTLTALCGVLLLTDRRHRLRLDRIDSSGP